MSDTDWNYVDKFGIRFYQVQALNRAELLAHWVLFGKDPEEKRNTEVRWCSVECIVDERWNEGARQNRLTMNGFMRCVTPTLVFHVKAETGQWSRETNAKGVWVPERLAVSLVRDGKLVEGMLTNESSPQLLHF